MLTGMEFPFELMKMWNRGDGPIAWNRLIKPLSLFTRANYILCELYLNKALFLKRVKPTEA